MNFAAPLFWSDNPFQVKISSKSAASLKVAIFGPQYKPPFS